MPRTIESIIKENKNINSIADVFESVYAGEVADE